MRILIAVAHADDETLGCYSLMSNPQGAEIHVLHATNSAPVDPKYAQRAGFDNPGLYADARRAEIREVLAKAGIPETRYRCLAIADQEAPVYWPEIRKFARKTRADRIYTHAYEGGHPDHDAVAFALRGLPNVFEFPLYHGYREEFVPHSFLDGETAETIELTPGQQRQKQEWLDCFRSQKHVLANFPVQHERFRHAKQYDFSRPPHPGELYYERRQLGWTWPEWAQSILSAQP